MAYKDPAKRRVYDKQYRDNHREKIAAHDKKYRKNHREEITERNRKWAATLKGKIGRRLRTRLYLELKGRLRAASPLELLGCSIKHFLSYIEKQFKPGMTWENYSRLGWNLDHIMPCASFDLTDLEQQRECFHYTNFQPLWWGDHLIKHAKYKEAVKSR